MYFQEINSNQIEYTKNYESFSIQHALEKIVQEEGFLLFYDETDPLTEWLGNFYPIPVTYNGLTFSNAESAFQAQKFIDNPEIMSQFTTLSGAEAFRKSREYSTMIRPDWLGARVQIMKEVLTAKIDQNSLIESWLDATCDSFLVEHNPVTGRDTFWSDDHDGTGKNMLGILWMELRSERRGRPGEEIGPSHRGWQNYQKFLLQLRDC